MKTYHKLICEYCKQQFNREIRQLHKQNKVVFCSKECNRLFQITSVATNCGNCNQKIISTKGRLKSSKSGFVFCCQSCAATYNNTHKTWGIKRSKLEKDIEAYLTVHYPELNFITNDKVAIGSELDFYFPDLKLAIEVNGIFHFEPIFGEDKLTKIKDNDKQKLLICAEKGIELAILSTHNGERYSKKRTLKYLSTIDEILKLSIRQS